jgi:hypothetical protein
MNNKRLVKLSNSIGIISIILLIYWVFIFISITVFGLRIFRENITEIFYLSIVGILALMFGALIINIMFNLTRIAEKHNQDDIKVEKSTKSTLRIALWVSFPIILVILFGGDYLTSKKKESLLISSAKSIIDNNSGKTEKLVSYTFTEKWILETSKILELFSKTDKHFPNVAVIVADTIDNSRVFLAFNDYYSGSIFDTIQPQKINYIQQTTKEERDYLENVFYKNLNQIKFNANKGNYELYYPFFFKEKKIVLFFSDYQRYGKIGS